MEILQLPSPKRFDANYFYIIRHAGKTVALDPGCAETFQQALASHNWSLNEIWITHHHWDHTDGLPALANYYKCKVIGPVYDQQRTLNITDTVKDNDTFDFAGLKVEVLYLPGHTLGHIAYYIPTENTLFSGDVLFGMGCGRIFEGTYEQTWQSLQRLASLPDDTKVYCAHEYTQTNTKFCQPYLQDDKAFQQYAKYVAEQRLRNQPTVPLNLGEQKKVNPFLSPDFEQFKMLREARNSF